MSEIVQQDYLHNSTHKEFIRDKWVEFIEAIISDGEELGIITFPAEEMQDLLLLKDKGLIDWEINETGNYTVTKGKIICFEKRTKIYLSLREKLVNAMVEPNEIGLYLRSKYQALMSGKLKIFPVTAINLDYDGNLSKNSVPIQEKVDLIFKSQAIFFQNFSLFLTWPHTEDEDTQEYKDLLRQTIADNLEDANATIFRDNFLENFNLDDMNYDNLSIIGLTKLILRNSSNTLYKLVKHEYYIYGEEGRHKMYSILLNFEYLGAGNAITTIYSQDVISALTEISTLQKKPEA